MAKEVKLRMTLDEKGAVTSVEKIGSSFRRTKTAGTDAGKAGHSSFLQIAAGAAIALGAIQLVQGGYRALRGFIKSSITETAQLQDETAKLSHRIGVSTETLSAYRLATELSGTSMQALATALRTTAKNAYDMSNGTGEAKDAFNELGLDVTDNNGKLKDAEEIMLEVADRLVLIEDSSRRTAIAQKIFGRSGTELLPMLENGRAGIEAMKDEAKALGMTFTDETAAASEAYNDSITRMNGALSGLKMTIGNEVIPTLTDLFTWMVENKSLMSDLTTMAKGLGVGILDSVQWIATALENWYGTILPFWTKISATQENIKYKLSFGLLGSDEDPTKEIEAQKRKAEIFANIAWQIEQSQVKANLGIRKTAEENRKLGESFSDLAKDINKAISAEDQWNNALLSSSNHEIVDVRPPDDKYVGVGGIFEELAAKKAAEKAKADALQDQLNSISGASDWESVKKVGGWDSSAPGTNIDEIPPPDAFLNSLKPDETISALDLMKNAALEMGQAGAQAFGQWARGSASLGTALRQATVQVLANLATQNMAYAITETAHGLAALAWGNFPKATAHFAAAAQFGLVAGLSGLAARSMSGGQGGMGASGTAFNPIYTQSTANTTASQQINSGQAEVMVDIRDTLSMLRTQPAGVVVKDGVGQNGGVVNLMNDKDKTMTRNNTFRSRYA